MGRPGLSLYGNADVGSAVEDIKNIVAKIDTNKFDKKDILKLHKANTELITALLNDDYKD